MLKFEKKVKTLPLLWFHIAGLFLVDGTTCLPLTSDVGQSCVERRWGLMQFLNIPLLKGWLQRARFDTSALVRERLPYFRLVTKGLRDNILFLNKKMEYDDDTLGLKTISRYSVMGHLMIKCVIVWTLRKYFLEMTIIWVNL